MNRRLLSLLVSSLKLACVTASAASLGTTLTYQGQLQESGRPVHGLYDFQFSLWDAASSPPGALIGETQTVNAVTVNNGLFTATLDLGTAAFTGDARWLEIAVRTNGLAADLTTLRPRQPVTPTPYALRALALAPGEGSQIFSTYSVIGGGRSNTVGPGGTDITIGGGQGNWTAEHAYGSTIGGGRGNHVWGDGSDCFIGGGSSNQVGGGSATVAGGQENIGYGSGVAIGGGTRNTTDQSDVATIGGGRDNRIELAADAATIAGGASNVVQSHALRSTIGGGHGNTIGTNTENATIGGGRGNENSGNNAFLGGGISNSIGPSYGQNSSSVIGGGMSNVISESSYSVLSGGRRNDIWSGSEDVTIGGGQGNTIQEHAYGSTIAGGVGNLVQGGGSHDVVGGGKGNTVGGGYSTVNGGISNSCSGWAATVAGGDRNISIGYQATVGGGHQNTSSGEAATVPGGSQNTAGGSCSFAAGRGARALHEGAFVWSDSTDGVEVASTNANSWTVRASGGVSFFTAGDLASGVVLPAGSGSWSALSDRAVKDDVLPVDGRAVLEQVSRLPLSTWRYKFQAPDVRHVGPMAQDFHTAFGVGEDDRHISSVDADGVSLAAIQGLNQKLEQVVKERDSTIAALEKRLTTLEQLLASSTQPSKCGAE